MGKKIVKKGGNGSKENPLIVEVKDSNIIKKQESHNIKYEFTPDELAAKADQISDAWKVKCQIDDQKKSVMSDFKSKLDSKEAEINLLANHLSNKFEFRSERCDVEKDFNTGIKTYSWKGIVYDKIKMEASEYQMELPIETLKEMGIALPEGIEPEI